ncbi:2-hydroxycarboxylate transporter family protein [Telmatospirillum sp.]|uniref:2-hydroxycarboxylate transporter family protein n=1 Tax=Telmatospirillum sp. TaxID=2079197 RepID=UPI002842BE21|nr:2-hydroxycarboxylate transporter family protein [Telmatospirillum sp.]MDR3437783.1 2-hydroxycarboxylate transporter family protein [Telmatospirillum sp.]
MSTSPNATTHDISAGDLGAASQQKAFWPYGWWKIFDFKIGIVPLPIYFVLIGLIAAFIYTGKGKLSSDILVSIAILAVGGFTCAELGKRLPIIKNLGAAAIFATFLPSYLVYAHLLPEPVIASTKEFFKASNFLYLYIACIIVGSIVGMDRQSLIKGIVKIFIPLACGVITAAAAGTLVGTVLGLGTFHTFFYIIVPMMGGGVGEGVIPISIGYSLITHGDQGVILAEILPMVMMGSLTCIVFSGLLNHLGKRRPELTGDGRITPDGDQIGDIRAAATGVIDPVTIGAAGVTAVALYLIGVLGQKLFDFPAPVSMLFIAFVMKAIKAVSPQLQQGGQVISKFFATSVTYPLLFSVGVSITPWEKLTSAFTFLNIVVIVCTVVVLMTTGFFVAKRINMYPIDVAVVCSCSAAQGGTGDVAILTAANRLQLLPFCSIATRLGGATMVSVALVMMRLLI